MSLEAASRPPSQRDRELSRLGVTYSVAAGNSNANARTISPASTATAITVGATTISDAARHSELDPASTSCPGDTITSDYFERHWHSHDERMSMATPHVTGRRRSPLEKNPSATPAAVASALVDRDRRRGHHPGGGSPNRLLFDDPGTQQPPPQPTAPGAPTVTATAGNSQVTLSWSVPSNNGGNQRLHDHRRDPSKRRPPSPRWAPTSRPTPTPR
jgi:subtilisin family serine protease